MENQTVQVGKLHNSISLFNQNLDLRVVKLLRDSTWNFLSIDPEGMELRMYKMISMMNGKNKQLLTWEKLIICWIQDLEVEVSQIIRRTSILEFFKTKKISNYEKTHVEIIFSKSWLEDLNWLDETLYSKENGYERDLRA